jgi:hypothetical protein
MRRLGKTVQSVHFEDFSAPQFERLVFAYLLRLRRWRNLEWYGQVGCDLGRDIWGVLDDDARGVRVCVQCANRKRLGSAKVLADLEKIVAGPGGSPHKFLLVAACNISARARDQITASARTAGIYEVEIWSGAEFEERLRRDCESLLKRFVEGVEFPDSPEGIQKFVAGLQPSSDEEILALMAELFDRPAFYTPFSAESSIPAFKKAISDTIEALNTGVHRLRDGTEIRRIPSRHQIRDPKARDGLARIVDMLIRLRSTYDQCVKTGEIRACGCNVPDCPVFFTSPRAAYEMDSIRSEVISAFGSIHPPFDVHRFLPSLSLGGRWYRR